MELLKTPFLGNMILRAGQPSAIHSLMDRSAGLRTQVERFKSWATSLSKGGPLYGEWEMEYPHWEELYRAASDLLLSDPFEWDQELKNVLLYAIARDNEAELIIGSLSRIQIDALASSLLTCIEPDAKWQIAEQIGKQPLNEARRTVLLALASEENEYVRRRAINVLTTLSAGSLL
jgi:hypothetical protein